MRCRIFGGYTWPVNYDAAYHVLLTMKAYAAVPFSDHYLVPLVSLGAPMDKGIPWGDTLPGKGGNYFYLSFPALGFVLPYLVHSILGIAPTFSSLMWFNFAIHAVSAIVLVRLCGYVARLMEAGAATRAWIMFFAGCSYILAKETMIAHGPTYWHHSLYQPILIAQILVFARIIHEPRGEWLRSTWLVALCFLGALTEWTAYVANAGVFAAFLFLGRRRAGGFSILAVGVAFATFAAAALVVLHFSLAVDPGTIRAYLESRMVLQNTPGFRGYSPLKWVALTYDSFSLLFVLGVLALGWLVLSGMAARAGKGRSVRILPLLFVASFPVVENWLVPGHAQTYHFDRAKIAIPLILGLTVLCAAVRHRFWCYLLWSIAIGSNMVSLAQADRSIPTSGGVDVDEMLWARMHRYDRPCTLVTARRGVRGYENVLTGRSIVERVPDVAAMQALTRQRQACLGIWLNSVPVPTGWWNQGYVYDPAEGTTSLIDPSGAATAWTAD